MGRITKLHLCAFWQQERLLQARHYAGKWDMTGGRGKAGEIPIKAACRELQEELNITVTPEKLAFAFEKTVDWDDGTGLLLSVFMCRVEVPEDGFRFDPYEVNYGRYYDMPNIFSASRTVSSGLRSSSLNITSNPECRSSS